MKVRGLFLRETRETKMDILSRKADKSERLDKTDRKKGRKEAKLNGEVKWGFIEFKIGKKGG